MNVLVEQLLSSIEPIKNLVSRLSTEQEGFGADLIEKLRRTGVIWFPVEGGVMFDTAKLTATASTFGAYDETAIYRTALCYALIANVSENLQEKFNALDALQSLAPEAMRRMPQFASQLEQLIGVYREKCVLYILNQLAELPTEKFFYPSQLSVSQSKPSLQDLLFQVLKNRAVIEKAKNISDVHQLLSAVYALSQSATEAKLFSADIALAIEQLFTRSLIEIKPSIVKAAKAATSLTGLRSLYSFLPLAFRNDIEMQRQQFFQSAVPNKNFYAKILCVKDGLSPTSYSVDSFSRLLGDDALVQNLQMAKQAYDAIFSLEALQNFSDAIMDKISAIQVSGVQRLQLLDALLTEADMLKHACRPQDVNHQTLASLQVIQQNIDSELQQIRKKYLAWMESAQQLDEALVNCVSEFEVAVFALQIPDAQEQMKTLHDIFYAIEHIQKESAEKSHVADMVLEMFVGKTAHVLQVELSSTMHQLRVKTENSLAAFIMPKLRRIRKVLTKKENASQKIIELLYSFSMVKRWSAVSAIKKIIGSHKSHELSHLLEELQERFSQALFVRLYEAIENSTLSIGVTAQVSDVKLKTMFIQGEAQSLEVKNVQLREMARVLKTDLTVSFKDKFISLYDLIVKAGEDFEQLAENFFQERKFLTERWQEGLLASNCDKQMRAVFDCSMKWGRDRVIYTELKNIILYNIASMPHEHTHSMATRSVFSTTRIDDTSAQYERYIATLDANKQLSDLQKSQMLLKEMIPQLTQAGHADVVSELEAFTRIVEFAVL